MFEIFSALCLLIFGIAYGIDSSKNRGWIVGYYGELNQISNSLAQIPTITISNQWANLDLSLEEFGFDIVSSNQHIKLSLENLIQFENFPARLYKCLSNAESPQSMMQLPKQKNRLRAGLVSFVEPAHCSHMNAIAPVIAPEPPPLRWDNGVFRIGSSRVTLDSIVWCFNNGDSPEEIARNYDALTLSEVYRAIGYYLEHRSEIDAYIARSDQQRDEIRREVEARHDPVGIRERLLQRKQQRR